MAKKTKKQILCEQLSSEIIAESNYLLEDYSMPKSVRVVIKTIASRLDGDFSSLEVSTILYEIEEAVNGIGTYDYRSTVWGLISKLETLKEKMK